jgi:hypothetical protein
MTPTEKGCRWSGVVDRKVILQSCLLVSHTRLCCPVDVLACGRSFGAWKSKNHDFEAIAIFIATNVTHFDMDVRVKASERGYREFTSMSDSEEQSCQASKHSSWQWL